jgi:hypothetical protein
MRDRRKQSDRERLRKYWRRWTEVIALFAEPGSAHDRVVARDYAALRNNLIGLCRSLADTDSEESAYYASLEEMVQPWLNPRVLAGTDRELLATLLLRCRGVEKELKGRIVRSGVSSGFRLALLIIAGSAAVFGAAWVIQMWDLPVLHRLRDSTDWIMWRIRRASDLEKLFAAALVIAVVSIYTASRASRS